MRLVNDHLAVKARLVSPSDSGYILLAAELGWRGPLRRLSPAKRRLLAYAKARCEDLAERADVVEATLFRAVLVAPGEGVELIKSRAGTIHHARYDVVILIRANTVEAARKLRADPEYAALAAAVRNFELNQHLPAVAAAAHTVLAADAFEALAALRERRQRFDLVIVDPPALAKQEREIEGAVRAYRRLTRLSLDVLAPAGTLVMASCSSRVSAADFFATVEQTAAEMGHPLHVFGRSGHALDHPIGFAEGAYLKCLFASVR